MPAFAKIGGVLTRRALIIGASGGIGSALASALEAKGSEITGLSRSATGFDLTDHVAADNALSALDGVFDRIVVASGILAPVGKRPEKSLNELAPENMATVLAVNAIGPAIVLRHAARLLPRNLPSVCSVLTARVGSIGDNHLGGWYSYRAAKAAANQIVRTAAIEIARTHKLASVVAMHPGTVATQFTKDYGAYDKSSPQQTAEHLMAVMDRLTPEDSGRFFDWAGDPVPW